MFRHEMVYFEDTHLFSSNIFRVCDFFSYGIDTYFTIVKLVWSDGWDLKPSSSCEKQDIAIEQKIYIRNGDGNRNGSRR